MSDLNDVTVTSKKYNLMASNWPIVRTLMGGTAAMRAAGSVYLPKYEAETEGEYAVRLSRAVLTNYYQNTISHLVGKAFSKPLVLKDDVPGRVVEWAEDIDLQGTHLNQFAADLFHEALGVGLCGILVDYPRGLPGATLADERASGNRPYWVMVPPEDLLGVRMGGSSRLEMARIKETYARPVGPFGEEDVERVRVLTPGGFALYERAGNDKSEWIMVEDGAMRPLTEVPLVPVYGAKRGAWYGTPPLLDLAYKNVQHYQIDSDVKNALSVACFPILSVSGWTEEDPKIEIGPRRVLAMANPQSKAYYVEHSGAAIGAGRQMLEDLKADMATMGLQMMMPQGTGTNATATETQVKYAESTSALQRMAFGLKDALENALMFTAQWIGEPDGGSIELRGVFELPRDAAQEVQALIQLRAMREITSGTLLSELVRRNFLPDDFDAETEMDRLELEGPGDVFGE